MFGGAGAYVPDPGSARTDMVLRLHEIVDVLDMGLVKHHARAILDSGERHMVALGGHFLHRLSSSKFVNIAHEEHE